MLRNNKEVTRRGIIRTAGALGVLGAGSTGVVAGDESVEVNVGYSRPSGRRAARDEARSVRREFGFDALTIRTSREGADRLRRRGDVRYVEENGTMHALGHAADPLEHASGSDPTSEQVLPWGIDRVDADVAHHADETGSGSSVAIIDTGIDPDHETLNVTDGRNFVDCDNDDDPVECADEWDDGHGHGTHCAGTANALDNDVGVVGVSTDAALYAVKVLSDDGSGTWSDVAAGIEWTADQGIDVGSLSLGGGDSNVVEDACEYAYGEGTLLVAAAGNDGKRGRQSTVGYPAAYDQVVAVSAIDRDDDIASFSSRGQEVELAAPGVDVLSSIPDDGYDEKNGTSMACPHVSGAGAQLMANGSSNTGARDRLDSTAEDIGLDSTEQGNGLLDVAAALDIDGGDGDDDSEDDGDAGDAAPTVDQFELVDESNPRWARVEVDWTISDGDGDLAEVTTVLNDGADSETSAVDGSSASGTHELRERDGHGEAEVTLTVTDATGNQTSETDTITLG